MTSTKNDVTSIQNSISGINGHINNINNVNAVQSQEITNLNSLGQQTQSQITQLQQSLSTVNSSLRQQLDSQSQYITSVSNSLATTNSQVSNLQNQMVGTKNDVVNIQNAISDISGQINNINYVDAAQNADIASLKAKTTQEVNGAFWCLMSKNSLHDSITGYCTNLNLCCSTLNIRNAINGQIVTTVRACFQSYDDTAQTYTVAACGTFVSI
ncbi:Hypothetical_protein [Hexamita inflata]|uniref:Hypothetical_protein n=1 Tax=Hexamita inflata TaxID=28002 RepID=A0AA86TKF7_9EUKA|nr:Hypothetical protein HINF_LOCUS3258 [Hexamita inflata]